LQLKEKNMTMKFKNILLALAIPALAFLAACGGGDSVPPKPNVTFQTGTGFTFQDVTVRFDSVLKVGIRATTKDKKLAGVKVTLSTNGAAAGTLWDTMISSASFDYNYIYKVKGGAGDVQTFTVVVTDDNKETASQSFSITLKPALMPLKQTGGQRVNNIIGANKGAYDLNAIIQRASGESESLKDLKDLTVVAGGGVFSKSWGSGNNTKFARVTLSDWNTATNTEALFDLWNTKSSSATSTITNIAVGDYIVCKTGQAVSFNIYLIRVDKVTETAGDNNDFIEFTYYKEDI
jgi:hypothetical protein